MSAGFSFDVPIKLDDNVSDSLESSLNSTVQATNDTSPQSTTTLSDFQTGKPAAQRNHNGSGGGNKKGNSAERRATHNAIERARRESLNGRFLQLAASLPAIADVRRPSKSLIVNKSLDFVSESLSRETLYRLKIEGLRSENALLREQLNEFRRQAGLDALPSAKFDELPKPLSEMGDKKRSSSFSAATSTGAQIEFGDLDDDDSLFAPVSEGDAARTSPTPSGMVPDVALHGTNVGSMASRIPRFSHTQANQFGQNPNLMSVPAGLLPNLSSSSASAQSSDCSPRERPSVTNNANWMSGFEIKNYVPYSGPNALPAQDGTASFSDFSFSGSSVMLPGAVGQSGMSSTFPHQFLGSGQPSGPSAMQSIDPLAQPHGVDTDLFASVRNAHAHAQQSHSQSQSQPQRQQQQQQQFAQQQPLQLGHLQLGFDQPASAPHSYNAHSFFENAPRQTAQFMAAV